MTVWGADVVGRFDERLRRQEEDRWQKYPNAHIALVTANIQDRVQRRVQDAGLGFIPKPITEDKILTFLAHAEPDHA